MTLLDVVRSVWRRRSSPPPPPPADEEGRERMRQALRRTQDETLRAKGELSLRDRVELARDEGRRAMERLK